MRVWSRSRDLLFKFWDPANISGTAEDTNQKFCMHINIVTDTKRKKMKNSPKGAWPRSRATLGY